MRTAAGAFGSGGSSGPGSTFGAKMWWCHVSRAPPAPVPWKPNVVFPPENWKETSSVSGRAPISSTEPSS